MKKHCNGRSGAHDDRYSDADNKTGVWHLSAISIRLRNRSGASVLYKESAQLGLFGELLRACLPRC